MLAPRAEPGEGVRSRAKPCGSVTVPLVYHKSQEEKRGRDAQKNCLSTMNNTFGCKWLPKPKKRRPEKVNKYKEPQNQAKKSGLNAAPPPSPEKKRSPNARFGIKLISEIPAKDRRQRKKSREVFTEKKHVLPLDRTLSRWEAPRIYHASA